MKKCLSLFSTQTNYFFVIRPYKISSEYSRGQLIIIFYFKTINKFSVLIKVEHSLAFDARKISRMKMTYIITEYLENPTI